MLDPLSEILGANIVPDLVSSIAERTRREQPAFAPLDRSLIFLLLVFWCLLPQASPATQMPGTTLQGTNRDAEPKTIAMLAPVRAPAAGKSNYRVTLKLLDGTHVGNYSVTVKDNGDAWTVTGYWPRTGNTSGEITDVATLEKGTLLLRKEAFQRFPNQAGQTSNPVTIDLDFTGNTVTGTTTSAGADGTPVSAELSAPTYPGGVAIDVVIGCLPLAKGYAVTYRYWNVQTLKEGALQVKVVGTERIAVPVGTFDSWKLELTTVDGSERGTLWIAKDSRTPIKSSGSKTVGPNTFYSSTELVP